MGNYFVCSHKRVLYGCIGVVNELYNLNHLSGENSWSQIQILKIRDKLL